MTAGLWPDGRLLGQARRLAERTLGCECTVYQADGRKQADPARPYDTPRQPWTQVAARVPCQVQQVQRTIGDAQGQAHTYTVYAVKTSVSAPPLAGRLIKVTAATDPELVGLMLLCPDDRPYAQGMAVLRRVEARPPQQDGQRLYPDAWQPWQDAAPGRPAWIGHRCCPPAAQGCEYTEAGARAAVAAGASALEVSVWPTQDGVWACSHDWTLERTAGQKIEIWKTPWEQIAALRQTGGLPYYRLEQLLDVAEKTRTPVLVDHKPTSGKTDPPESAVADGRRLVDWLCARYPQGTVGQRVGWKEFHQAQTSPVHQYAAAHGLPTVGLLYEADQPLPDPQAWTWTGAEWSSSQAGYDRLAPAGRPRLAHIIDSAAKRDAAARLGATVLMCPDPGLMGRQ